MPFEIDLSVIPEGRECGLLESEDARAKVALSCRAGEVPVVRDRTVWAGLLGADGFSRANLRQYARIRDQTGPSCGSAAMAGAFEALVRFGGRECPPLSSASLFTFVGSRFGSTLQDNLDRISEVGICPESFWPDDRIYGPVVRGYEAQAKPWRLVASRFVPDFDSLVWAIFCGNPGIVGVNWSGTGHLIWACRVYRSASKGWGVEIANSWGVGWGDDGFGVLYEDQVAAGIKARYGAAVPMIAVSQV